MSENEDTSAGSMDDDSKERVKDRKKKQQSELDKIFADNKTGRYGKGVDS